MTQKFISFRLEDARKYLSQEQIKHLTTIIQTINAGRQHDQKEADFLLTLNMRDKFAIAAADAYVAEVRRDPMNELDPGCEQAVQTVMAVRNAGIFAGTPRKPKPVTQ